MGWVVMRVHSLLLPRLPRHHIRSCPGPCSRPSPRSKNQSFGMRMQSQPLLLPHLPRRPLRSCPRSCCRLPPRAKAWSIGRPTSRVCGTLMSTFTSTGIQSRAWSMTIWRMTACSFRWTPTASVKTMASLTRLPRPAARFGRTLWTASTTETCSLIILTEVLSSAWHPSRCMPGVVLGRWGWGV